MSVSRYGTGARLVNGLDQRDRVVRTWYVLIELRGNVLCVPSEMMKDTMRASDS